MVVEARVARELTVTVLSPSGDRDQHDLVAVRQVAQRARQLVAIELGQTDVEERDVGTLLPRGFQRVRAVVSRGYLMAERLQQHHEGCDEILVVVRQQHPLHATIVRRSRRAVADRDGGFLGDRQVHHEPAAVADPLTVGLKRSTVQLDQAPRQ